MQSFLSPGVGIARAAVRVGQEQEWSRSMVVTVVETLSRREGGAGAEKGGSRPGAGVPEAAADQEWMSTRVRGRESGGCYALITWDARSAKVTMLAVFETLVNRRVH